MGDRISIQFQNGEEKSVVLFSHWGGQDFLKRAKQYVKGLKEWHGKLAEVDKQYSPLSRFEPRVVMVDFIRELTTPGPDCWLGKDTRVDGDLYFGFSENDGDNSDNGHHIIKIGDK